MYRGCIIRDYMTICDTHVHEILVYMSVVDINMKNYHYRELL